MQAFHSPIKQSAPAQSSTGALGSCQGAAAPDTSNLSAEELWIVLQSQEEAIGQLQARLEAMATTVRRSVPDLTVGELGSASWWNQSWFYNPL